MKQIIALIGAPFAALAASACCILPVILGATSVGTLGVSTVLTPYRPYFMALTMLLLGIGFYFTYRPAKDESCEAGYCETGQAARLKRFNKALLWSVTLFTIGALAYPTIATYRAQIKVASAQSAQPVIVTSVKTKTAVFAVGQMTCAACSQKIADALKKTPGVHDAKVNFNTKRATVYYDGRMVGVPQLSAVIELVGYSATEIQQR